MEGPYYNEQKTEANAEFIVKACNSHYQLLEACKFAIEQAGLSLNSPSYMKLQKAINQAEGR